MTPAVTNQTALPVFVYPFMWPDQQLRHSLIIKASYDYDAKGNCHLSAQQAPLAFIDEPWADGESIKQGLDLIPFKPATDVIVTGDAYVGDAKQAQRLLVSLSIGKRFQKTIEVAGERRWEYGFLRGWYATDPEPFTQMPLQWERAFGGSDASTAARFDSNPWGCAFVGRKSKANPAEMAVPNLELPGKPITEPCREYPALGFSFVSDDSSWRSRYLGTYDQQWEEKRKPFLAEDFDFHFFQQAPPDQIISPYLQGHEMVELINFAPVHRQSISLASVQRPLLKVNGKEVVPKLDTVHILSNNRQLQLVWRLVLTEDCQEISVFG